MKQSEFWTGLSCVNGLLYVLMAYAGDPMFIPTILLAVVFREVAGCCRRREAQCGD